MTVQLEDWEEIIYLAATVDDVVDTLTVHIYTSKGDPINYNIDFSSEDGDLTNDLVELNKTLDGKLSLSVYDLKGCCQAKCRFTAMVVKSL